MPLLNKLNRVLLSGDFFPNHYVKVKSKTIILYAHGNGGSLGDFKNVSTFYSEWVNSSVWSVEYPGRWVVR